MSELQNNKVLHCAIIGYGGMGSWHARHIARNEMVELCGVYDINPQRCELAVSRGIHVYPSLEALLADETVECVTVATPNDLHKSLSIAALRAGKHVISEKPVMMSLEELDEVIAVAHECGRRFTVHQNRRWDEDFLMMKELYDSGAIGKVFNIESRYQGSRGIPGDWRQLPEHGGGMILDWGVHLIDQMLLIYHDKKIKAISCRCDHITNKLVDDGFKLDIIFDDDAVGRIEVGTTHYVALPRFYVNGMAGAATVDDWTSDTHIVAHDKSIEEGEVTPVVTAAGLTKTMAPHSEEVLVESTIKRPVSDVNDFYRNYARAIWGEEEQIVTHAQMRRVMRVMETAFLSDREQRTIAFDDN